MMSNRSLNRLLCLSLFTLCTQTVIASDALTVAESDTLAKEDIAAAQVLVEVCPTLIGKNPAFDSKIQNHTQTLLKDLKGSAKNLEQLAQDAEYQTILKSAKLDAKEVEKEEQKSVCEDVLNIES